MTLWFGHFPIQAIWEAAKWNGIHPAFLMENPKSIGVSLWNCRGPWVPSCGWRAYPNNPGQIACFSAAQLFTFFRRKTTDRHIGMDNEKKHARCVMRVRATMCVWSPCFCIHTCGKGRFVRPPGNHQKWDVLSFHGSDSRTVSKRKTHQPSFKFCLDCFSIVPDLGFRYPMKGITESSFYTLKQRARGSMWGLRETLSYLLVQNVVVQEEPGENSTGLLFFTLECDTLEEWAQMQPDDDDFLFTFGLFWL